MTQTEYQTFKEATEAALKKELSLLWPHYNPAGLADLPWLADVRKAAQGDYSGRLEDRELLPIELLYSYWLEESGIIQCMHAVSLRFQNKAVGPYQALARFDITPLRSIADLIWGYIQDEAFRLSLRRRAYEYAHQYGLKMIGRAVVGIDAADSRSRFLPAFHELLNVCVRYYRQADDKTVVPDGRPLLHKLKELYLVLAEGAHNQYGRLPLEARLEMKIIQLILERPEIREFLGGRVMVPYPEPWMDRVDTLRRVMRWGDTSVTEFHNLAENGERILLLVRFGSFGPTQTDPDFAETFARNSRNAIIAYINAYQAVTGVDLGADTHGRPVDATQPSVYLHARERRLRRAV